MSTSNSISNTPRPLTLILMLILAILPVAVLWKYPDFIRQFDSSTYLGLFILTFLNSAATVTLGFAIPIPGLLLIWLAGGILNPFWVGIISGLGSGLGEAFAYPVGVLGSAIFSKNRIAQWVKLVVSEKGGSVIFFGAIIPNPFFDLWGLAAGLANYPFRKFMILVMTARILRALIVSLLGYYFSVNGSIWIR